jgi:hypothetical protein
MSKFFSNSGVHCALVKIMFCRERLNIRHLRARKRHVGISSMIPDAIIALFG